MGYTPLFVGPLSEGIRKDLQPFMLPNEAYPNLQNAYEFRGVIYRKGGNTQNGRLGIREEILVLHRGAGATNVAQALIWPPVEPGSIQITDTVTTFTDDGMGGFVITGGAGAFNPTIYATGNIDVTFNTPNAGAQIAVKYNVAIDAHSPVMGLRTLDLDNTINTILMGFDTQMSYRYDDALGRFRHNPYYRTVPNYVQWTGSDKDFFYSTNYQNAFWATNGTPGAHFYAITAITQAVNAVITIGPHNLQPLALPFPGDQVLITNVQGMTAINGRVGTVTAIGANTITVNIDSTAAGFNPYTGGGVAYSSYKTKVLAGVTQGDGIRWYDNNANTPGWVNFSPPLDNNPVPQILQGALMIFPYHNRLVCLNTWEGTTFANKTQFTNRARWSRALGSVFQGNIEPTGSPADNATFQWVFPRGDFKDAPTSEDIVSAELIKDTLIVFFERSTWALDFTGNPDNPFYWERLNIERGSDSTFSTIAFDNYLMTIGKQALVACSPAGVERADLKIPDQIVSIANANEGYKRTCGIRDLYNEFVFWTFVAADRAAVVGGQGTTAFPNRVLSYNYRDDTWAIFTDYYTTFGQYTTSTALTWGTALYPWGTYYITWGAPILQSGFPILVGGNAQGFVNQIGAIATDAPNINSPFFNIQDISAAVPSVVTCMNHSFSNGDFVLIRDVLGAVTLNNNIYQIQNVAANTFTLADSTGFPVAVVGYINEGTVTAIDQMIITTKRFNPTLDIGHKVRVGYIDLFIENSEDEGRYTLNLFIDEDESTPAVTKTIEAHDFRNINNNKFWYRCYVNQVGQFFTMQLTFSTTPANPEIFNFDVIDQSYSLYGFTIWTADAGRMI